MFNHLVLQVTKREDIFDKLPHELRHEIFKLLPAGSILALKAASWATNFTARLNLKRPAQ
jgi:hypothetical protein